MIDTCMQVTNASCFQLRYVREGLMYLLLALLRVSLLITSGGTQYPGKPLADLCKLGLNDIFEHHDDILDVHYDVASCCVHDATQCSVTNQIFLLHRTLALISDNMMVTGPVQIFSDNVLVF